MARAAPSEFKQTYFPLLLPRLLEVLQPQQQNPPNNDLSPSPLHHASTAAAAALPAAAALSSGATSDPLHHAAPGTMGSDLMESPDGMLVSSVQIQVVHVLLVSGPAVEDSVFVLMPALIRLLEHADTPWEAKTWIVGLLAHLTLLGQSFEHYIGPRLLLVLHRMVKLNADKTRKFTDAAVYCLGAIAYQLQDGWLSYKSLVDSTLSQISSPDHVAAIQSWSDVLNTSNQRISIEMVQRQVLSAELKGWYTAAASAPPSPESPNANAIHVNQANLKRAWEASQRSTKEALRFEQYQDYLVRALETAFQSDTIPAEILQTLLNLAEFMEHDVEALPIDIRELGELAQKCHAYAKALHYKELEFHTSPSTESYLRAYHTMITLQQLSELEEIIAYKKMCISKPEDAPLLKRHMVAMWSNRLAGCKRVVDVWQHVLAVRSLVLSPHEDVATWLQFASLCRQSNHLALSLKVFTHALSVTRQRDQIDDWRTAFTPVGFASLGYSQHDPYRIAFAYLKHLWAVGDKSKALNELGSLVQSLSARRPGTSTHAHDLVKCQLKWAEWQMAIHDQQLDKVSIPAVLSALKTSTELDPTSYKAWHAWALMNFHVVDHQPAAKTAPDDSYVVSAIE
ncbi:hypothetical protein DYB37_008940, partial [Aphanomyces astaci]